MTTAGRNFDEGLNREILRIGSFQMAIYTVGNYLLNVNFALGTGLQTSAVTLIGRSYGEKNRKRISDYRKAITKLGMISSRSPVSILLLLPCLF